MKRLAFPVVALLAGTALAADPMPTLKQAAGEKLLIGAAVSMPEITEPARVKLLTEQYSCITTGNAFKPLYLHPRKGEFNFAEADKSVTTGPCGAGRTTA
jgi:endo-1,4-beta-xylanase